MARRRHSVTITHVAAHAGVSHQTVSRVINNEPNVRPEMKERVQSSIDSLGYVPLIAAQRLGGARSYLILAINDRDRTIADWRARQGADWVDQMLLGGMLKCAEHGYRMIFELVDTHSDHIERELLSIITGLQPDGILLTPPHSDNPQIIGLLANKNIPFARIGSRESGLGMSVSMDDEGSARLATRYLIQKGHKQIGFIAGPKEYRLSGWRVDGWKGAMAEAELSCEGLLAEGDFSYVSGELAAHKFLTNKSRPTAIIASNDQMALATLEVATNLNISVPKELSIVSFDNTPLMRVTQPPLTAIDQPIAASASKAIELIVSANDHIKKKSSDKSDVAIVTASLVERGSVSSPGG